MTEDIIPEKKINFDDFKVRCSSISKVLSNSRSNPQLTEKQAIRMTELRDKEQKNGGLTANQAMELNELEVKEQNGSKIILSDTCIEYLMVEYAWRTEGMISVNKESMDLVAIKKGIEVELAAGILLSRVDKVFYKTHEERIYNDYLSGEIDYYAGQDVMSAYRIVDNKASWDYPIFLKKLHTGLENGQEEQVQGYMDITGAGEGFIANTLIDTPDHIIEGMRWALARKLGAATPESPEVLDEWPKWEKSMRFSHIPMNKRVSKIKIDPFTSFEQEKLYDRVKVCREWLNKFHERYQKLNIGGYIFSMND